MTFSILIVDDKAENRAAVRELVDRVSSDSDIAVFEAESVSDAKIQLSKSPVDLVVVDIALPQEVGGNPMPTGGIRFLQEVHRKSAFENPRYVVGITAMEEVDASVEAYFEENLWFLLYSKSGVHTWKTRFENFFEKIVEANISSDITDYDYDVFIIGSKPDIELAALRDLPLQWSNARPLDDSQFFREASLELGANEYRIGIGAPPRLGLVSATMYSAKIVEKLRPRFLCMTGICAGVKDECNLGDVILAEESWEWQTGKYVSTGETFRSEPYQLSVPQYVSSRIEQLSTDKAFLSSIHDAWRAGKPTTAPVLRIGPIASGSAVVADQAMVEMIKGQHRKLLGIDMEIYGSYYSGAHASMPKPTCFALKSVSDFADSEKSDEYQAYCSSVSALVLFEFFKRYLSEISGLAGRI